MVHARETRAHASEVKFLVRTAQAPVLLECVRRHLTADPHGGGPFGDEYETTTLYFDTPRLDVYHRRGSFGRAKYRARRYGTGDVAFLERKLRKPGVLIKRRTMVPIADLGRVGEPAGQRDGWGGEWFNDRLRVRSLAPVCQVFYHRTARQIETPDGPARVTLDNRLRVGPVTAPRFHAEPCVPFAADRMILELKYRKGLPAAFRRLVEEFALRSETVSKYRLGGAALGWAEAGEDQPAGAGAQASFA